MQNNKSDIIVAKSTDFGATWSYVIADATNAGTDKPILAVRRQDVDVVYTHAQTTFVAYSHDGGQTFIEKKVDKGGKLGWALAGGGTVTPNGNVFFAWAGYEANGGTTWTTNVLAVSSAPPQCPEYNCGWAYLVAQMVMASDANGVVHVLWNADSTANGPERIYSSNTTDNSNPWSTKVDVSTAPAGTHHNFPALAAIGNGDVRISWMDSRAQTVDWTNGMYIIARPATTAQPGTVKQ